MTIVSVFDLDRTLTRRPTYFAFLLGAARRRAPWRFALLPLLALATIPYALGLLPRRRMKEVMHRLLLGASLSGTEAATLADAFVERLVRDGLYRGGMDLIAAERAAGSRVVLATAASALYVAPLARRLGIADVVATASVWRDGRLTCRIENDNCYGRSKYERLSAFLAAEGLDRSQVCLRFFSDHLSDLPTFEWCDDPVAVNPSPALRRVAEARGWTILDWRGERAAA